MYGIPDNFIKLLLNMFYTQVDFLIGGDGPKRLELEEIREQYGNRVQLFGKIDHALGTK